MSAWEVLPTLRSIEINQNFEVEKVKFRTSAVILAFAMAAWLPVAGQSAPPPAAPQDSSKDVAAKHLVAALTSSTAQTAPVLQITMIKHRPAARLKMAKKCLAALGYQVPQEGHDLLQG